MADTHIQQDPAAKPRAITDCLRVTDSRTGKSYELPIVDGAIRAGRHDVMWDGRNDSNQPVGSGVYFYRLATTGKSLTKKMVLLK